MSERITTFRLSHSTRRGFTLLELMIGIVIVSVLLAVGSVSFRAFQRDGAMALARNAIMTYASQARSYAIANQIETMLVINPYNGRFEMWHLNPPRHGGVWNPYSNSPTGPNTDGYAFAPVLDDSARLPVDGNGNPLVVVNPLDYEERSQNNTLQDFDNLMWTALCFDESGKLVTRVRRIATRTATFLDGTPNTSVASVNRIGLIGDDSKPHTPNLKMIDDGLALVTVEDSLIKSTRGFVISDRRAMENVIGRSFTPAQLAGPNGWLQRTRPRQQLAPQEPSYRSFTETVVLDRYSGQAMIRGGE